MRAVRSPEELTTLTVDDIINYTELNAPPMMELLTETSISTGITIYGDVTVLENLLDKGRERGLTNLKLVVDDAQKLIGHIERVDS